MSQEEAPVPATIPAGPQPHRCNDRVEDVIQALYTLNLTGKVVPAWKNMRKCFKSEKGQEPKDPYVVITDGQQYLERRPKKPVRSKPP